MASRTQPNPCTYFLRPFPQMLAAVQNVMEVYCDSLLASVTDSIYLISVFL